MDNISGGRFLLRILSLTGLWRFKDETNSFNLLGTIRWWLSRALHVPFSFVFTALMLFEMLKSKSLDDANDVVYMSLTEAAFVVKVLSIWKNRRHLQYFVEEITSAKEYVLRTEEKLFWQQQQKSFNRFAKLYHFLSFGTVMSGNIGVLLTSEYELPFMYWVPFDWRVKPNYWYAYGYDCLSMLWTSTSNACLDMSFCFFLRHLSLLYKLLGMRLLALQNLHEKEANTELHRIFKMHRKLKKLTTSCEIVISLPILSQIILSAIVLCFSGYRLQNMDIAKNLGQFLAIIQFLAVLIFQIYLPCYYANEVTVNSNQLTTDIYSIDWHQYSVSTKKLIFIYMEFLKRPTKVKAGGYFEVGLPIFTKTINNAYSFFALLLNVSK